ncbi:transposon Ty3-G Gag-Pol polyprotein [Trichonephila clavipes]|nr:transposon Ty3-G Gag-Pol polyprotein [Trichonephila clavipes]
MAAPVSCFRIGKTCYNEKSRALVLIRIREVEVAANQGASTILRENIAITISDLGRSASLAANPGYLSRTEKPDVNSLWIAEQTSRSSLGQKRKASPLHLVNKKDGTLRPCGDYRRLNAQTIPDRYPIPRIEDFNYILKDKKIFSKIDLVKAYYQIPIAEEDKKNCPLQTPSGLLKLVKRFEKTGKLEDRARDGRPCLKEARAPCIAVEMEAIASESASGTSSASEPARRLGLPPSSVRNILRRILQLYPYKLQSCHELLPGDTAQREALSK